MFRNIDSGASNRSTMFVTALSTLGHVDMISFLDDEVSNVENCKVIYSKSIPFVCKSGRLAKLRTILTPWQLNSIYPLNVEKERIIDEYVVAKKYDYIAIRYVNEVAECGLLKYANRLLLDVDDDPILAIKQKAKGAKTLRNKVFTLIQAMEVKWVVASMLQKVYRCYHSNIQQVPCSKSIYLHNVAMSSETLPDITDMTPMRLLVIGTYHYAPNRDGLNHFLRVIYPKVRNVLPNIELRVVGRIYDESLAEIWRKEPNVTLVGYVEDLKREYEQVRMAIIPLYSGIGTSIKFIEAVGLNRVCVTTPQGVRGMDAYLKSGENYLMAKTDSEFVKAIVETITVPEKCNTLAHNAKKNLDSSLSKEKFIEIVKQSVL